MVASHPRPVRTAEEAAMVRFSYAHIPAYPLDESIKLIKVADELGYYAAYACDETWWKDMWLLFAAAARDSSRSDRISGAIASSLTKSRYSKLVVSCAEPRARRDVLGGRLGLDRRAASTATDADDAKSGASA
jgi:hypothetical protein